jgi:alpha-glucosidase
MTLSEPWWRSGVLYQIYTRSFGDTNGDGVGDLDGVTAHLDYVASLGVAAIWLTPFYRSPMADFGYDISDHTGVDPLFGDLTAFDRLLAAAHERGIRVVVDYVPNHTSEEHPWFEESRSSRDNAKRDWFFWRDSKPDGSPPNNWISLFGGPAWERDERTGQHYMHTFLREQPDLNWRNPQVQEAMFDVARFWLDRGVDGFRVDVAGAVMKDPELRDNPSNDGKRPWRGMFGAEWEAQDHIHDFAHPDVFQVWRDFRDVVDGYDQRDGRQRVVIGEVPSHNLDEWARYYGEDLDAMHLPFGFHLLRHDWASDTVADKVDRVEDALPHGAVSNWVLGNHDQPRIASWAGPERARVTMMLLLTLRGAPTLYYGDELGMTDVQVPPHRIQDPWERNVPGQGRDGARTPMPWTPEPHGGFTAPDVEPWLPMGEAGQGIDVATQEADPRSMLALTRRLIELRNSSRPIAAGSYDRRSDAPDGVFAFCRAVDGEALFVALNLGSRGAAVAVPGRGGIVASTGLDRDERVEGSVELEPYEGVVVELDPASGG